MKHRGSNVTAASLRRQLYAFAFTDEFVLITSVFPIWFLNSGLSAGDVSWLFALWAGVGVVLEVPSGALADRVDRRRLLATALCLRAVGIACWFLWPSFAGVIVGVLLWALHTALASGTWESLVFEELEARGEREAYASVMARIAQASQGATAAGTLLASAVLYSGGSIPLLGWLSVFFHGCSIAVVLTLPRANLNGSPPEKEPNGLSEDDEDETPVSWSAWLHTLREGVVLTARSASRVRLLVVGAFIEGLFILDEFQPLLASARGADEAVVPLLAFAVWVGLLGGAELAARRPQLSSRMVGALLSGGAVLALVAVGSRSIGALCLVAVTYAFQNTAWILTDARFQERVPSKFRATITSVRAFLAALINTLAFALVALFATAEGVAWAVTGLVVVLLVVGIVIFAERDTQKRETGLRSRSRGA